MKMYPASVNLNNSADNQWKCYHDIIQIEAILRVTIERALDK